MIGLAEYRAYDAIGLAQLVRHRDVSSAELANVALAAIERLNPHLNAVIRIIDVRARTSAEADHLAPEAPFRGVYARIRQRDRSPLQASWLRHSRQDQPLRAWQLVFV